MDVFIGELIFVLAGFLAGCVAGLLPGVGVLASLIVVFPLLMGASVGELILFYMALAATVQYVGTVPSVFVGIPGETNSAPAVLEGDARKHGGWEMSPSSGKRAKSGCL